MTSSLRAQAARGVLWSTLQNWGNRLTTTLAFIVISRQLQPSEFGLVALSLSITAVLTLLGDVGMASYIIRKPTLTARDSSTAFWTSLVLASGLSLLLAVTAPLLSRLFGEPGMTSLLWALCGGLIVAGAASVPTALIKRDLQFKVLAVRGTVATVVGSVVAITLALLGAGAWALVIQSLVRGVIAAVFSFTSSRWLPSLTFDRPGARAMLNFGSALLSIDLLVQMRDRGEDFILATVSGATTLGFWSVASRLVRIIQETGSSVVSAVATPTFARVQEDRRRLHRGFEVSLYTAGVVMFPALLLLAVISPDLIPLLLGQQWAVTAQVAQVIAITTAVAVFTYFDRAIFVAVGRLRPEVFLVVGVVVVHLGLVVAFAGQGLMTLAVVLLVRAAVFIPIRGRVLHVVTGMPVRVYAKALRTLLAAVLMAGLAAVSIAGIDESHAVLRVLVAGGVSAVSYPVLVWLIARPVWDSLLSDARSLRPKTKPDVLPVDGVQLEPVTRDA